MYSSSVSATSGRGPSIVKVAEVHVDHCRQQLEPDRRIDQRVEKLELLDRLLVCPGYHHRQGRQDLDRLGRAAEVDGDPLRLVVKRLRAVEVSLKGEDDLAVARGEFAAGVRRPSPSDYRIALDRTRAVQRSGGRDIAPMLGDDVEFLNVVVDAGRFVPNERVRSSKLSHGRLDRLDELSRAFIAGVVRHQRLVAEAFCHRLVADGHNVPTRTTAAEMIKRREPPCDVVGLLEGGVGQS